MDQQDVTQQRQRPLSAAAMVRRADPTSPVLSQQQQQQQQQRRRLLRQETQTLLENIQWLVRHNRMDEHMAEVTTKEAEALVGQHLDWLRQQQQQQPPSSLMTTAEPVVFTTMNTTMLFSDMFDLLQKARHDAAAKTVTSSSLLLSSSSSVVATTTTTSPPPPSDQATAEPKLWVAPTTFERRTHKYWVDDRQLGAVLLLASTKAPLLVYGRSRPLLSTTTNVPTTTTTIPPPQQQLPQQPVGTTTTNTDIATTADNNSNNNNNNELLLWHHVAVPVSSVYFDSPHLDLYHGRLSRHEGARILRARWYGRHRPVGEQVIYLELKTHHEAWVMDRSVKERVAIPEKYMVDFLSPGVLWTYEVAHQIIAMGADRNNKNTNKKKHHPDNNNDQQQQQQQREKDVQLLLTMKELVVQYNLRPCVRSVYERVSFQSADNNALRMTLDRRVTLLNEETTVANGDDDDDGVAGSKSSTSKSLWCMPDNDDDHGSRSSGYVFPYSILEIKVATAGTDPVVVPPPDDFGREWEDAGLIIDAAKFSKFQTGVVAYHQKKVRILPYWAAHPSFAKSLNETFHHTSDTLFETQALSVTRAVSPAIHDDDQDNKPTTTLPLVRRSPLYRRQYPPVTPENSAGITSSTTRHFTNPPKIAPQKPARIEPKTYFANERTFIQWMSGSFLLVTVATILFDIGIVNDGGDDDAASSSTMGIAVGLLTFAAIISCYAVFLYYRRLWLLETRQPHGYNERHGPVLLSVALLVGIVMLLLYFSDVFTPSAGSSQQNLPRPVLRPDNAFCIRRDLQGINLLHYQPSDVLPLADRPGVLLVPSLSQITSVSVIRGDNGSEVAFVDIVADLADVDIEAVAQWRDRILAVSEGGDKRSTILEFQWTNAPVAVVNGRLFPRKLEIVSSITIASPRVEGLAVINRDLYVAGNVFDEQTGLTIGTVDVYTDFFVDRDDDSPTTNSSINRTSTHIINSSTNTTAATTTSTTTQERTGHRLNAKLLGQGLRDSKIGSLYYFEDVLYILHDNAQLIRGWRLDSSEQVLEWWLPAVPSTPSSSSSTTTTSGVGDAVQRQDSSSSFDFDKQWEGLALERRPNSDVDGNTHRLFLHLTLDSPPQVWTFQLTEAAPAGTSAIVAHGAAAVEAAQNHSLYPSLPACAT